MSSISGSYDATISNEKSAKFILIQSLQSISKFITTLPLAIAKRQMNSCTSAGNLFIPNLTKDEQYTHGSYVKKWLSIHDCLLRPTINPAGSYTPLHEHNVHLVKSSVSRTVSHQGGDRMWQQWSSELLLSCGLIPTI